MSTLDTLIYDPERLTCTDAEKDACLETVKKLARLWLAVRREGYLVVITLAAMSRNRRIWSGYSAPIWRRETTGAARF